MMDIVKATVHRRSVKLAQGEWISYPASSRSTFVVTRVILEMTFEDGVRWNLTAHGFREEGKDRALGRLDERTAYFSASNAASMPQPLVKLFEELSAA